MGQNLQRLKDKGAVDPEAADNLDPEVINKIEQFTPAEIETIIKFKLDISGTTPWEPKRDGSIL